MTIGYGNNVNLEFYQKFPPKKISALYPQYWLSYGGLNFLHMRLQLS